MRLEINEEVGQSITLTFTNDVTVRQNGGNSINVPTRNCRIEIDFSKALFYQSMANYLYQFQQDVGGRSQTFRFRDPSDNKAESEEYDTGLGVTTQGVMLPLPDGVKTQFQLFKVYQLGDSKYYRMITRPTGEDLEIFKDAVAEIGFILADEIGVVTFNDAPDAEAVLTWSGSFDIPCRFNDIQNVGVESIVYYEDGDEYLYQLPNLKVIEVKETSAIADLEYTNVTEPLYDHVFGLDWSYGSVVYPVHNTVVDTLDSGFENRKNQGRVPIAKVSTTSQEFYYQNQIEYLIGLYRLCYGTAGSFKYPDPTGYGSIMVNYGVWEQNMLARFTQPLKINVLREDITDPDSALFRVDSMDLRQTNMPVTYRERFYPIDETNPLGWGLIEEYHVFGTFVSNPPSPSTEVNQRGYFRTLRPVLHWDGALQVTGEESAGSVRKITNFYEQDRDFVVVAQSFYDAEDLAVLVPSGPQSFFVYFPPPPFTNLGSLIGGNTETITKIVSLTDVCQAALDAIAPANFTVANITATLTNLGYVLDTGYNHLSRVTHWCHCWLLTRTDGQSIGFTDHDFPLTVNSIEYDCTAGFNGDAIALSTKVEDKNTEVKSYFSAAVTAKDVTQGKYRYAEIRIFAYDWLNKAIIRYLFSGYIADISLEHDVNGALRYTFSAVSNENRLEQRATRVTTKTCSFRFGDSDCTKDLTDLTDSLTVDNSTSVSSSKIIYAESARANGFYNNGVLTFTSGELEGISRDIFTYSDGVFTLWQSLPLIPSDGDTFDAVAGCNKTIEACTGYDNFINFGGQPYVPGTDRIYKGIN